MTAHVGLSARLWLRGVAGGADRRTLVLLVVGVALSVWALAAVGTSGGPTGDIDGIVGTVTAAILGFVAVTGPWSVRLPTTLADVHWRYGPTASLRQAIIGVVVWKSLLHTSLWVLAAAVAQVLLQVGGSAPGLIGAAARGAPAIAVASLWASATGVVRGRAAASTVVASAGAVLLLPTAVALVSDLLPESAVDLLGGPVRLVATGLGGAAVGSWSLLTGVVWAALALLCVAMIARYGHGEFRYTLAADAYFWADLPSTLAVGMARESRPVPSWTGGGFLGGPLALIWFDIAVLRRGASPLRLMLYGTVLLGTAIATPGLAISLIFLAPIMLLIRSTTAGAFFHRHQRHLLGMPSNSWRAVAAAEFTPVATVVITSALIILASRVAAPLALLGSVAFTTITAALARSLAAVADGIEPSPAGRRHAVVAMLQRLVLTVIAVAGVTWATGQIVNIDASQGPTAAAAALVPACLCLTAAHLGLSKRRDSGAHTSGNYRTPS